MSFRGACGAVFPARLRGVGNDHLIAASFDQLEGATYFNVYFVGEKSSPSTSAYPSGRSIALLKLLSCKLKYVALPLEFEVQPFSFAGLFGTSTPAHCQMFQVVTAPWSFEGS